MSGETPNLFVLFSAKVTSVASRGRETLCFPSPKVLENLLPANIFPHGSFYFCERHTIKVPAPCHKTFSVAWKYISVAWKYILVALKYISKALKKFLSEPWGKSGSGEMEK